jgi:membrane protease YdiL (CAAX protease family)
MRAFLWFFGLILFALAVMALGGYPAWLLLHPHFDFAFHRIASRLAMLVAAVGLLLIAKHLRLMDRASFGYGAPRRIFLRECGVGLLLGVISMALIVAVMLALGLRRASGEVAGPAALTGVIAIGLLRGCAVALIEETFLRGAMFTAIARESGARSAMVLTALVYAATHFIGRYHIDAAAVNSRSGLDLLMGTLHAFADPAHIVDAFACYAVVGAVLGAVRARTGNIAACIGLHAGWVWVIAVTGELSQPNASSPLHWLLSSWDGTVGWLVCAWTILAGVAIERFYRLRSPAALNPRSG